ncbi:MAG: histidinol-phosphate transaminase, partial [Mucinivorans sp.]
MREFSTLVRPNILALAPYSTARDESSLKIGLFLDANESPWDTPYNRYPDPHQKEIKALLSEIKGV